MMFYFENTRGSRRDGFEFRYGQARDLGVWVTQTNNGIREKTDLCTLSE